MGTTAQSFYPSTTEQDFTAPGEGDIRKLAETVQADATQQTNHPSSAGTTSITLDPYTNRSTQNDVTADYGWAINRLGGDGMESATNARRFISVATNWSFRLGVDVPAGGTITGSHAASFIVKVYRVSSTGTRSLLFSGQSSTVNGGVLGASGTCTLNYSSLDEFTLEPNETIHVGFLCRDIQTAGALGATTAGNLTWHVGELANVILPTPGIRTYYERVGASELAPATDGTPARLFTGLRNTTESATAADTQARAYVGIRALSESAPAADAAARKGTHARPTSELAPASDGSPARLFTGVRNTTESATAADTQARAYVGIRALSESAPAVDAAARKGTHARPTSELAPASDGSPARLFTGVRNTTESAPAADAPTRLSTAARAVSESAPAVDATDRKGTHARPTAEVASASDNVPARVFIGNRTIADVAPAADTTPTRAYIGARSITEAAPAVDVTSRYVQFKRTADDDFIATASDATTRIVTFVRTDPESAPASDSPIRSYIGARTISEFAPAVDIQTRLITYGRTVIEGPADVITYGGYKELVGKVYDPDGDGHGGADVWLIRESDRRVIQTTTSDVDGVWRFPRDLFDNQTYLIAGFATINDIEYSDLSDDNLQVVDVGSVTPGNNLNGRDPNIRLAGAASTIVIKKIFPVFG